jgi:hypothetical protein
METFQVWTIWDADCGNLILQSYDNEMVANKRLEIAKSNYKAAEMDPDRLALNMMTVYRCASSS